VLLGDKSTFLCHKSGFCRSSFGLFSFAILTIVFLVFGCKLQAMKIKTKWLSAVFVLLFCSGVFASPATDLFHQVKIYMQINYNGVSKLDLAAHIKKYEALLEKACADKKDTCDYAVARGLIDTMISELEDGHTFYFSPAEWEEEQRANAGQASSTFFLGIRSQRVAGSSDRVIAVVRGGSPALEAGLLRGDRMVAMNNQNFPSVDEKLDERSAERQKQEVENNNFISQFTKTGQPFKISLLRAGKKLEITAKGGQLPGEEYPFWVRVPNLPNGVAVMQLPSFVTPGTAQKIHNLFAQAIAYKIQTVIIDQRDNGGGRTTECVAGPSAFVPDLTMALVKRFDRVEISYRAGSLYYLDSSDPSSELIYRIQNPVKFRGQIAVLVNEDSASCAEILADAVQHARRGVVIGTNTAGVANTGANQFGLLDKSGIQITTIRTVRGDGTLVPDFITPNYEVKNDLNELMNTGRDLMLEKALDVFGYKAP
jgi:carboxyl-terminal processing protease